MATPIQFNTTQLILTLVIFGFMALSWFAGFLAGQKKLKASKPLNTLLAESEESNEEEE